MTNETQAVPAEDVAELVGRAISKALGWQPSEDGPSYRETRQEVERLLATASEAEAASLREQLAVLQRRFDLELDAYAKDSDMADLRRKLEEHRKMLAEARERINRYADTAAEHDLVARIDALAAPLPEDTHHGR